MKPRSAVRVRDVVTIRRRVLRIFLWCAVAVGAGWLSGVRLFAFSGDSMVPAVKPGDTFLGLVGVWGQRAPARFDKLIFDLPPHSPWASHKIVWMKRLIGLPGEHVRLAGAELFINGRRVAAPMLYSTRGKSGDFELQLGPGEFCVVGDNLDHSLEDSRAFGALSRSLIRGRALFLVRRAD